MTLHRQDLSLQLETEFGSLHEITVSVVSKTIRAMPQSVSRSEMTKNIAEYYKKDALKLISLGIHESVLVDLVLLD